MILISITIELLPIPYYPKYLLSKVLIGKNIYKIIYTINHS